ncbi:MAG: transcriptional regulator [Hyphomicrobiaceae bacterium]|nr:transcriptional regulator [Hyphomicrobiaceae bacterium]
MNRGPQGGSTSVDHEAKARAAWGPTMPEWVATLAEEANRSSQTEVAKRLGYSPTVISQVLGAKYPGDLRRVEDVVRGALLAAVVECPVLGEIGRDRCRQEQSSPFRATNSTRSLLRRACKSCEHKAVKEPLT